MEALWQSTPSTIRHAVEPLLQSDRRTDAPMSLHISAIRTYRETVACFGTTLINRRDELSKTSRAVTILCASVIAVFSSPPQSPIAPSELVDMLVLTLQTLKACVDCGGSNLAASSRTLADSVAYTCTKAIHGNSGHPLIRYLEVRLAILRLSCSSLCVPYQDGSAASYELRRSLRQAAQVLKYDQVDVIVLEAMAVLRVCQAMECARRPALYIATKCDNDQIDQFGSLEGPVGKMAEKLKGIQAMQEAKVLGVIEQEVKEDIIIGGKGKAGTKLLSMSFLADAQSKGIGETREVVTREPVLDSPKRSAGKLNDDKVLFDEGMPAIADCDPVLFDEGMPAIVDCDPDIEDVE
jgi:hypothetical protein